MNEWSTGWTLAALALFVRAAVSKDRWWLRVPAVLLGVLSLISQSLALELRERFGEPETRKLFLILWEQAPYYGSLYLAGWAIFSRDPKWVRIISAVIAVVGLWPIVAFLLIILLGILGAPVSMH